MIVRPWWDTSAVAEVAHQMALLPLVWLVALAHRGKTLNAAWWWLASAFFVSWLADTAVDVLPRSVDWVPVLVYPILQSSIVGAVFLSRGLAAVMLWGLTATAGVVALTGGSRGPDVVSTSASFLAVVGILFLRSSLPARLRACLFVYFGVGLMAWLAHIQRMDLATYWVFQGVRLIGLLLFCWAAIGPERSLKAV